MNKKEHNDIMKFLTAAYLMENARAYWYVSNSIFSGAAGRYKTTQIFDLVIDDISLLSLEKELSILPEFKPHFKKNRHKVMGIAEATFKQFRQNGLLKTTREKANTVYAYKPKEKIFTPFYMIHTGRA